MNPVFQIPDNRYVYLAFFTVVCLLTWATFGSLSEHLYDAFDDRDHLTDTAKILEDPAYLFSSDRLAAVRPTADLAFVVCYLLWEDNPAAYHIFKICLHFFATLLLVYALRQAGVDLELSFLSAVLFLMNVAHFRAVHWITSTDYNLALIFSLIVLICFIRYLDRKKIIWIVAAALAMVGMMFAHPSGIAIAPFCTYFAWRKQKSLRMAVSAGWPLIFVGIVCAILAYWISPQHAQARGFVTAPNLSHIFENLLWYLGRLLTAAHWLPRVALSKDANLLEMGIGWLGWIGILVLCYRRIFPVADWAIWAGMMVLPFLNHPSSDIRWWPVGPSRQVYLASAGLSVVLAWGLRAAVDRVPEQRLKSLLLILCLIGILGSSFIFLKQSESITFYLEGRGYTARQYISVGADQFEKAVHQSAYLVPEDTYFRLSAVFFMLGRSPQDLLEKAQLQGRNVHQLNMLLGICAFFQDDPDAWIAGEARVRKEIEKVENKDCLLSEAAICYNNLGLYYYDQGDFKRAQALFEAALYLLPGYWTAQINLAEVFHVQGKVSQVLSTVREIFQEAIQEQPQDRDRLEKQRDQNMQDLTRWFETYHTFPTKKSLRSWMKNLD